MSETEQDATNDTPPVEGVDAPVTQEGDPERDDALAPAEDADTPGGVTDEQHVSSVTALPEGAEVDPLTDARPEPVQERETHDE